MVNESDLHLNEAVAVPEVVVKYGRNIHVVSDSYWTSKFDAKDLQIDSREFTKYGWLTEEEAR